LTEFPESVVGSQKLCPKCQKIHPRSCYRQRRKNGKALASYCRSCERAYLRGYYHRVDASNQILRVAKNCRLYREQRRRTILEYLSTHPCTDCGEHDPTVLEFDHVRGQKRASVSRLRQNHASEESMLLEISKCEVRCVNCHRRKTFRQFNYAR